MDNLVGFGIPFILQNKTREEKIEEARQSGLIGPRGDRDFVGAKYGQELVCKRCGSRNVIVGYPIVKDQEKGMEIPYECQNCGYEGTRGARAKGVAENGALMVDLIPDGLIGLEGYGSMIYDNSY